MAQPTYNVYEPFQVSHASGSPAPSEDVFGPRLTIDTNYQYSYSDSPSPVSTMPGTPQSTTVDPSSIYIVDTTLSAGANDYGAPYAYFSDMSATYSDNLSAGYVPQDGSAMADAGYYIPKSDFAYYAKPPVALYGQELSPPFAPTYSL